MDEEITIVREEPLTLILTLPDGCTSGRWEAAEAFADILAEMNKRYPGKNFQLLPFSYNTPSDGTNPALNAIFAVSQQKED